MQKWGKEEILAKRALVSHLTLFISYLGGEKEGEKDDPKTFDYQEHYDQIGRSLEVLGNKFSNKRGPNIWDFLANFENHIF